MKRSICDMSLIRSHIAHRRVVKCNYFIFVGQNSTPTGGCLVWLYVDSTTLWGTPPSLGVAEIRKFTLYFNCFIFFFNIEYTLTKRVNFHISAPPKHGGVSHTFKRSMYIQNIHPFVGVEFCATKFRSQPAYYIRLFNHFLD